MINQITALIVEDEINNQLLLEKYLTDYCRYITVIGKVKSIKETLLFLNEHKPDVLFLDIQLEDGDAFELINKLSQIDFEIIFVTSYESYAIKALKLNALDYLLKPIDIQDLIESTVKLVNKKLNSIDKVNFLKLNANKAQKIGIYSLDDVIFKEIDEIVYIKSDESYSTFYFTDNSKNISSKNIKYYEELLLDFDFFRIHKSFLINTHHIVKLHKEDFGIVELINNIKLPLSRRKRVDFQMFLKQRFKS
ncbi:MAG: response regulator transcription factor [Bacteroidales bacterium]|nr:response regulator transcription factor [Bacteroidales bacterium]